MSKRVKSPNGIELDSETTVDVNSDSSTNITSGGSIVVNSTTSDVDIDASTNVTVDSGDAITMNAGSDVDIDGTNVTIDSSSNTTVTAGAALDLNSTTTSRLDAGSTITFSANTTDTLVMNDTKLDYKLPSQIARYTTAGRPAASAGIGSIIYDTDLEALLQSDGSVWNQIATSAARVSYSNSTSGLTASDAQAAIDEVEGRVDTLEGATSASVRNFDTRTDVTTSNVDGSVDVIRTGGYSTAGDGGGATYKRVGAEPSHALKVQSNDGAWWELVPDPMGISVKQAGAAGDGTTDDSQAFIDAINGINDLNISGVNKATHRVLVPGSENEYYLGSTTIQLKRVVHILGAGSGLDNTPKASRLRWDTNVTGFISHTFNTIDATTEGTGTGSAGGSIIEGLHLDSDGGTIAGITDDTDGHGIWMRSRALVRNVRITNFPGNAINIVAAIGGSGGIPEGNANGWRIDGVRIFGCHKNGVYVEGADANAGLGQGIDVSGCGRAGIADHSFLGNTWIAPETEACGTATAGENGAAESSYVDFGGTRYIANRGATEAELVANQPGTDKTVWIPVGSGSANVTWQASQSEGTYFVGGSYICSAGNSVFLGAYYEDGQSFPQVAGMIISGQHKANYDVGGISMRFNEWSGRFTWGNLDTFPEATLDKELTLGFWQDNERPIRVVADGDNVFGLSLGAWDNAGGRWALRHGNDAWMYITSDLTTATYGRASAFDPGYPVFERGFVLGNFGDARHIHNASSVPSSGEHARGEFYFNSSPSEQTDSSGDNWVLIGWSCVTSGTPGTWVTCWCRTDPDGL